MLDIESYLLGKKAGGGGGGNPNSIQTITGNLNNPFGSIDKAELAHAIATYNASAEITFDTSALGVQALFHQWLNVDDNNFQLNGAVIYAELSASQAYSAIWTESTGYSLNLANMMMGGVITEIINYADYIPTTLTIYWHPMPT